MEWTSHRIEILDADNQLDELFARIQAMSTGFQLVINSLENYYYPAVPEDYRLDVLERLFTPSRDLEGIRVYVHTEPLEETKFILRASPIDAHVVDAIRSYLARPGRASLKAAAALPPGNKPRR